MPFLLLFRTSFWVREPGWGGADCDAGRYSLCDGDSPDADIDSYADTRNRHGYSDVRFHANPLTYAFSDRGNTCHGDLNADVNPYKHADANCNTIGYSRTLNFKLHSYRRADCRLTTVCVCFTQQKPGCMRLGESPLQKINPCIHAYTIRIAT